MSSPAASPSSEAGVAHPVAGRGAIERLFRQRMVDVGAALSGIATLAYGVFYGFGGTPEFVLVNFAAAVAFFSLALAHRLGVTTRLYLAVTIGLALFGIQLVIVADIKNGITPWLLVPAVAALIMGEKRLAAFSSVIAFFEPGLVVAATFAGWLTPRAELPFPNLLMLVSIVGVLSVCGSFAYISHQGRARLQREVDAQNAVLAEALEDARRSQREAVAASEAKDLFFANLTHEIRTPLNGIAGSAELLAHADLAPEHLEMAGALASSSRNLVALVNALLDHARLRAGNTVVDLAPLEVRRLTADIGGLFRAQARAKGLALEIRVANDVPEWVETDAVKVRQVVTNLVGNALKFTERGCVSLLVTCVRDGTDAEARTSLEIAVADTGVGITPELQESVFEPFVQAEASISRLHGGTGLGLAIARELAMLLGGSLTLRSVRGEGSTFTLSVPARQVAAPSTPAATGPADSQAGADSDARARVLLVEDNALNRTVATRMLARLGADVTVAENGIQAIRLASSERFDLVLMDLQMPVMDGITAASTIRACEAMAGLPPVRIVAMTGNAPEDYADDCAEAGMNGFVVKPVDLAGLGALLHGVARTAGDEPAPSSEPGRAAASA